MVVSLQNTMNCHSEYGNMKIEFEQIQDYFLLHGFATQGGNFFLLHCT